MTEKFNPELLKESSGIVNGVILDVLEGSRVKTVKDLYRENKLLIFSLSPEKCLINGERALGVVGISSVDSREVGGEAYLFLALNNSIIPQEREGDEKTQAFKYVMEEVEGILNDTIGKAYIPASQEKFKGNSNLTLVLNEMLESEPTLILISQFKEKFLRVSVANQIPH